MSKIKRKALYLVITCILLTAITAGASGSRSSAAQTLPGNASRTFPETGKTVRGIFLEYWDRNGGLPQQGFPISETMAEVSDLDGKSYTVQYFERAVFEHHPENQPPYDVLLSQLGTFQYRAKYASGGGATPSPSPQASQPIDGLFDAGGHKLYINCDGEGSSTVLMEAGLGTASSTWSLVLPDLRKLTRVCVYDRANIGRSERGPSPRTSEQAVKELRTLLASAGVAGPYLLVAHSHGGLHAQLFASKYRSEVVGMVMVDVTTYDIDQRYEAAITPAQVQQRRDLIEQNREGVTYDAILASYAQVRDAGPLPEVPLLVLTHGRILEHPPGWPVEAVERAWREAQEGLAKRSPKGRLIVAQNSGHFIHRDEPQLVIDSIREVLQAAR